jgi:hypothetical protein
MDSSQVVQSQPQSGEDVVLAAPPVEVEAFQVEIPNSKGVLQVEVSWIFVEECVHQDF